MSSPVLTTPPTIVAEVDTDSRDLARLKALCVSTLFGLNPGIDDIKTYVTLSIGEKRVTCARLQGDVRYIIQPGDREPKYIDLGHGIHVDEDDK